MVHRISPLSWHLNRAPSTGEPIARRAGPGGHRDGRDPAQPRPLGTSSICTKVRLIYKNAQTSTISIPTIRSWHDLNKHLLPNTSNLDFSNERNCLHSGELSSKMWHALSFLLKISIVTILLNYTKSNLTVQTITQLCIRLRYNNKYIFFTIYV